MRGEQISNSFQLCQWPQQFQILILVNIYTTFNSRHNVLNSHLAGEYYHTSRQARRGGKKQIQRNWNAEELIIVPLQTFTEGNSCVAHSMLIFPIFISHQIYGGYHHNTSRDTTGVWILHILIFSWAKTVQEYCIYIAVLYSIRLCELQPIYLFKNI